MQEKEGVGKEGVGKETMGPHFVNTPFCDEAGRFSGPEESATMEPHFGQEVQQEILMAQKGEPNARSARGSGNAADGESDLEALMGSRGMPNLISHFNAPQEDTPKVLPENVGVSQTFLSGQLKEKGGMVYPHMVNDKGEEARRNEGREESTKVETETTYHTMHSDTEGGSDDDDAKALDFKDFEFESLFDFQKEDEQENYESKIKNPEVQNSQGASVAIDVQRKNGILTEPKESYDPSALIGDKREAKDQVGEAANGKGAKQSKTNHEKSEKTTGMKMISIKKVIVKNLI